MLDDYYPRALQWCTIENIPHDVVSFDICKSCLAVLLKNNFSIPTYSIHDVIEPFGCRSDLRKCGEFYIDDVVLNNYRTPINIEAGFYSSNLVSYLVEQLSMPTKHIKYMITTKRARKPDTFSKFIEFLFTNFSEKQAKGLANSFIGCLGTNYSKLNQGFTYNDHDTAMCCWTSAMNEKRNITIDHCQDIYLAREQTCQRLNHDNISINRFVVFEASLNFLLLINQCCNTETSYGVIIPMVSTFLIQGFCSRIKKNKRDVEFSVDKIDKPFIVDCQ